MKFKILNHRYEDTGGGCMVGFDTVWLPEEQRTIFVHTNDQGCSFYPVDNYFNDLEEEVEPFCWINFDTTFPSEHPYGEVAKACLSNFIKNDYQTCVSWEWLPDFVRDQITDHYKNWVMEESDGFFTVERGKIYFDESYEVPPDRGAQAVYCMHYVDLVNALTNFRDAYCTLRYWWEMADDTQLSLEKDYPFHLSFGDLDVINWANEGIQNIVRNNIVGELLKTCEE